MGHGVSDCCPFFVFGIINTLLAVRFFVFGIINTLLAVRFLFLV